jgi:hypothetical protein
MVNKGGTTHGTSPCQQEWGQMRGAFMMNAARSPGHHQPTTNGGGGTSTTHKWGNDQMMGTTHDERNHTNKQGGTADHEQRGTYDEQGEPQ